MRAIGLVLAAVAFSLTFTAADAARRTDQAPASRSSAATARAPAATGRTPAATARPAMATSSTRPTARHATATSSTRGALVRTAYASPSSGHRSAASQRGGRYSSAAAPVCSRSVVRGRTVSRCTAGGGGGGQTRLAWQAGLAPAAHVQTSDCPEGTMATLATGHTNVVRCMPI